MTVQLDPFDKARPTGTEQEAVRSKGSPTWHVLTMRGPGGRAVRGRCGTWFTDFLGNDTKTYFRCPASETPAALRCQRRGCREAWVDVALGLAINPTRK